MDSKCKLSDDNKPFVQKRVMNYNMKYSEKRCKLKFTFVINGQCRKWDCKCIENWIESKNNVNFSNK